MSSIQPCRDLSDAVELCAGLGLFVKSIARLNISIQLPQLKTPGKSISNWEVMEKLRQAIKPIEFTQLKISKTTLEFIRFEGEVENRSALKTVVFRLDNSTLKLTGFPDNLRVRAAEAKVVFPTRHDWDSYFRDAKHMDEMKPGERPDTVYVQGLPCKWFADSEGDRPSEDAVKRAFSSLAQVRCVDIPLLDPYQKDSNATVGKIPTFSFSQDFTFDAYVQYQEYIGFVKAMDSLRGMKLVYKAPDGRAFAASIKVDFDKNKHLSEENKRKREVERAKLESLEREREERVHRERQEEERQREAERKRLQEEEEERERRKEEKQRRREERKRKEEEEKKKREEERRRNVEEEEKRRKEEEERRRLEEEERKTRAEEERRRKEEEEEALRRQEQKRKMAEERAKRKRSGREEQKRKEEEDASKRKGGKKRKEEEDYARRGMREDWEEEEEKGRTKQKEEGKRKKEERLKEQRLTEGTRKTQASQLLHELFQLLKEEKHKESEARRPLSQESDSRHKLLRQEQLLRERLLRNLEARKREKAAESLRTGDYPLERR